MYQDRIQHNTSFQEIWNQEYGHYEAHMQKGEKWYYLERLHILSQLQIRKHYFIHFLMLYEGIKDKNIQECVGQIVRIFLILPGHLLKKLPKGNVGTTRVGVMKSMDIPHEFEHLFV